MYSRKEFWSRPWKTIGMIIGGIALATLFAFAFGYFVMLLWNWLMPELFDIATISYWQAFGIIVLARLIFGSISHDHHNKINDFHSHKRKPSHWNDWKYYDEYWNEEGKQAFNNFVENKNRPEKEE